MKFLTYFLSIQLLITASAYGAPSTFPQTVCPRVTESAAQTLSAIRSLEDEIKKDEPNCAPLTEKLQSISKAMTNPKWLKVKDLMRSSSEVSLEGDDVEELTEIVSTTSQNLAEIVGLFSGTGNSCIDQSRATSFLSKLSTTVRGVSDVVGQVTGPYGMAVNLGGQFLSSAIIGIDKFISRNKIEFKNFEEEMLFVNQFCSFTDIHKDNQDYLGLDTRHEELDLLMEYLNFKVDDLTTNCIECKGYRQSWETKRVADLVLFSILDDINTRDYGFNIEIKKPTKCKEIHRAFHTQDSDFIKFIDIFINYKNDMMSKSDQDLIYELVIVASQSNNNYPMFSKCVELSLKEQIEISEKFKTLMDDILSLNDQIFKQQMNMMSFISKRKYRYDLVEYTQTSLERLEWIKKERTRVQIKLNDPNYTFSTEKLRTAQKRLEDKFMYKLLPSYIKYLSEKNQKTLKVLKQNLINIESSSSEMDTRLTKANLRRNDNQIKMAIDQTTTINRYCEYARYLLLTNSEMEKVCENEKVKIQSVYSTLTKEIPELAAQLENVNIWSKSTDIYQTSGVIDYANRIKDWNNKTGKWCLKDDLSCEN